MKRVAVLTGCCVFLREKVMKCVAVHRVRCVVLLKNFSSRA